MKLVEILARELEEWPVGVNKLLQSFSGRIFYIDSAAQVVELIRVDIAIDWIGTGVTRADWEAERAKLKAPKANGDGWIRHRGGKCPVEPNTIVIPKFRSGDIGIPREACQLAWSHTKEIDDVMRYKIHKPAEQPSPEIKVTHIDHEAGVIHAESASSSCGPVKAEWIETQESNPLKWRNRIRELDTRRKEVEATYRRQTSEITQERESLVQKLAGEGLALVEVVVQPVEDMSDPANWRKGDLITFVSGPKGSVFTIGKQYVFEELCGDGSACVLADDEGDENGWFVEYFKWHSRPAS